MTNVGPDHSILAKSLLEAKANIQYYISITKRLVLLFILVISQHEKNIYT